MNDHDFNNKLLAAVEKKNLDDVTTLLKSSDALYDSSFLYEPNDDKRMKTMTAMTNAIKLAVQLEQNSICDILLEYTVMANKEYVSALVLEDEIKQAITFGNCDILATIIKYAIIDGQSFHFDDKTADLETIDDIFEHNGVDNEFLRQKVNAGSKMHLYLLKESTVYNHMYRLQPNISPNTLLLDSYKTQTQPNPQDNPQEHRK